MMFGREAKQLRAAGDMFTEPRRSSRLRLFTGVCHGGLRNGSLIGVDACPGHRSYVIHLIGLIVLINNFDTGVKH